MALKICNECKTKYQDQDAENFGHCPKCDSTFFTLASLREETSSRPDKTNDFQSKLPKNSINSVNSTNEQYAQVADIERLIAAQNKTTHAIRAFVRFLFIQLSGITAAALVWYISLLFVDQERCFDYGENCDGNIFLQIVALGIWVGTVIYSSAAGWEELEKSEV
jgi:hypothetical protein